MDNKMSRIVLSVAGACFLAAGMAFALTSSPQKPPTRPAEAKPRVANVTTDSLETAQKAGREIATFGGGCFWCTERDFRKVAGILAADVGYTGGKVENPTYEMVLSKTTGHVEVTRVDFDPKVISYRDVVRAFFKMHDPTQVNRQGPDVGEQYRSVIYYYTPDQKRIAEEVKAEVQKTLPRPIATTIEPAKKYWRAEEYHQQYYQKMGIG
jgi:peptide-methionine (S)-S-oxide reductase